MSLPPKLSPRSLIIVLKDLLLAHPLPENLHILPTTRDSRTNLALSSRNAYLSEEDAKVAPMLYAALSAAKEAWANGSTGEQILASAEEFIRAKQKALKEEGKGDLMRLDYVEVFDKSTFEPIRGNTQGREAVVAGAVWVGGTRLIDNLLLGWDVE